MLNSARNFHSTWSFEDFLRDGIFRFVLYIFPFTPKVSENINFLHRQRRTNSLSLAFFWLQGHSYVLKYTHTIRLKCLTRNITLGTVRTPRPRRITPIYLRCYKCIVQSSALPPLGMCISAYRYFDSQL